MSATETQVKTTEPSTPPTTGESGARRIGSMLRSSQARSSVTSVVFLLVFTYYGLWLGGTFLNIDARMLDVHQNAPVILVGLAVMVTLLAGQFDLSAAAITTLTCFLSIGLSTKNGMPFIPSLVVCILVGIIVGLVNGLLVVKFRINTFIATLGTGGAVVGLSNVYNGGTQLVPGLEGRQLPEWFSGANSLGSYQSKVPLTVSVVVLILLAAAVLHALSRRRPEKLSSNVWHLMLAGFAALAVLLYFVFDVAAILRAISWTIAVLLVIALILWIAIRMTVFGRNVQATGSNAEAARLAGVRTDRTTIGAFMIGGLLAAVAGVLLGAGQGAASPDGAASFLLPAFGAAFLSTVIFSSGRYTVPGTVIGGIFVVWVSQGLIVGGVPFTWGSVVNGVVLIAAVGISTASRRSR